MKSLSKKPENIDEYILGFPPNVQKLLAQVRVSIKKAAPQAEEVISYSMPAFKMNSVLVWFAGYANHIGFYPKPAAIEAFKKDISVYKWAKGSVQFPLDKPLPIPLITKMVKFRLEEDALKAKLKKK